MPNLYIVATPIGNLEDISLRALRILGEVGHILCEDTRVSRKLLDHYRINTPTISLHQHSSPEKIARVLDWLSRGENLALITDAGTPGISDPGGLVVQAALERFAGDESFRIESIPGPSAVTAALSISGINTDRFVFFGFPPHKKGRQTFIRKIFESDYPAVVYESKHRIIKFLEEVAALNRQAEEELKERAAESGYRRKKDEEEMLRPITSVVVCREISKMHETVYRGEVSAIIKKIRENSVNEKGEFVVILGK